jgi:hypothetical protein
MRRNVCRIWGNPAQTLGANNMPALTKNDIHALRHAHDICVHLNARHPLGLVRLIKRKPYDAKPFETDQEHVLTAVVKLYGHRGRNELENGSAHFFAMRGIYHNQHTALSYLLKALRAGDELEFTFWPDAHTNGYVAMSGLHADVLYMRAYRKGRVSFDVEIETSICPSNSARMCKGVPNSEIYERDAEQARKVA